MKKFLQQLYEGIFTNNPVFVQLIGMCPTLATTTSLQNGIGMGLAATAVLICSNAVISLLRKLIPSKVRIAAYITIIAGFVTAVDLLIQAYLPDLSKSLGLFIPLIVVNCIILARAEAFASKNGVLPSIGDGLAMGLGFTFALCVLSTIREILGARRRLFDLGLRHRFVPETIEKEGGVIDEFYRAVFAGFRSHFDGKFRAGEVFRLLPLPGGFQKDGNRRGHGYGRYLRHDRGLRRHLPGK